MFRAALVLALTLLGLSGCATRPVRAVRPVVTVETGAPQPTGWRATASSEDQERIDQLPQTWARALAAVPRRLQAKLRAETRLVDPAAALELPAPPPGPYRCRLLRFGGARASRPSRRISATSTGTTGRLSFTEQTGQQPAGWLAPRRYADPAGVPRQLARTGARRACRATARTRRRTWRGWSSGCRRSAGGWC